MGLRQFHLYAWTLAGLRKTQWWYGLLRRVQACVPARIPEPGGALLGGRELERAVRTIGVDTAESVATRAQAIVRGEFTFLGHTMQIDCIDWQRRYHSHLWSYNLHYFDYARDLAWAYHRTGESQYAETFANLALSWNSGTEPGRGDGWQPYPISLRVVNWLHALTLLGDAVPGDARSILIRSLTRQAGWLERRLEKHLQANHLQKNHLALAVAGLFFEGKAATRWKSIGLNQSWKALREQVLEDGVHFERTPMYHAIVLGDFLELLILCDAIGESVPSDVRGRVEVMADAFAVLCRPDGSLHLFNDSANGVAPTRAHLERLLNRALGYELVSPSGPLHLPCGGYFGSADPDSGVRLLVDCGVPGPRYQPGHAHCDILSYELDMGGRPIVVDSGVHGYSEDVFRQYVRSTRAHNTVAIGEKEQSEIWGTYRVGRMATIRRALCRHDVHGYFFSGAYAPYHHKGWEHARDFVLTDHALRIEDRIIAAQGTCLRSFVHLHPRFHVLSVDGTAATVGSSGGETILVDASLVDDMRIGRGAGEPEGWYCCEFGQARAALVIEMLAWVGPSCRRRMYYTIRPA